MHKIQKYSGFGSNDVIVELSELRLKMAKL